MKRNPSYFVCGILLLPSAIARGETTFVDDFEGGVNSAGWSFNVTVPDTIEQTGGNPGAWLHNDGIISFAPILTTTYGVDSPFVGDYRAGLVTNIGIDARTLRNDFGTSGFQFALLLRDTHGTPGDPVDDDYTYFFFPQIPEPGDGWVHFDFAIPSQTNDPVPAGWTGGWAGDLENFRPGVTFADVISNVDHVEFWWIHPAWVAIIQGWEAGADNISISFADPPTPVPAVSTWGAVAMALLLTAAGTLLFRRMSSGRMGT